MSERRRGLGRGLGALIPPAPKGTDGSGPTPAAGPVTATGVSTSPSAVPVLTQERGVAAAEVTSLPSHVVAPEA